MKEILIKSFSVLKGNLIFLQPLLVCLLLFFTAIQYIINPNMLIYSRISISICIFIFTIAMITGTYYIDKKAIDDFNINDDDDEKTIKTIKNFKTFFEGIGINIFKTVFATVLYIIISIIVLEIIGIFCNHFFGMPTSVYRINEFSKMETVEQIKDFVLSLDSAEIYKIRMWSFICIIGFTVLQFFGFLYYAVLISEKENLIICFSKTVIFFLKNIISAIFIMLFMFVLYLLINIIAAIFGTNTIILAIFIIFMVLYFNYYIILVLCLYNERTKINSDSRTECIGKDKPCD